MFRITKLSLVYLILICSVLPLYMKEGYYRLGEAKALCFLWGSYGFAALFLLLLIIKRFITGKRKKAEDEFGEKTLAPCFFLGAYLFSCLLSFVFSVDKKTAFFGMEGWRGGLCTSLMEIVVCVFFLNYFEVKNTWKYKLVVGTALVVPFVEFILGILNRVGIYPIKIAGQSSGYLATIGNINWYAGFLSIFVPVGMGILFVSKPLSPVFFLSAVYTVVGLMALFLQGSEGAILIVAASMGLLLFISLQDRKSIRGFLVQLVVLGTAMMAVDFLEAFAGGYYNYDNNLLITLCNGHAGIILLAAALFLYHLETLLEEIKVGYSEKIVRIIYLALIAAAVIAVVVYCSFIFSDDFGNGRGIIWCISLAVFDSLPSWSQMVGVGQDCFYPYIQSKSVLSEMVQRAFGGDALTNAHCEILTTLIERGFVGAVSYVGLFASIIYSSLMTIKKERAVIICTLPIISYFVYNLISFAQAVSTPFVFICIGITLSMIREAEE